MVITSLQWTSARLIWSNRTYRGELLGILSEDKHYKKRDINIKNIDTINRHLADRREANYGVQEETPITVETVERDVEKSHYKKI